MWKTGDTAAECAVRPYPNPRSHNTRAINQWTMRQFGRCILLHNSMHISYIISRCILLANNYIGLLYIIRRFLLFWRRPIDLISVEINLLLLLDRAPVFPLFGWLARRRHWKAGRDSATRSACRCRCRCHPPHPTPIVAQRWCTCIVSQWNSIIKSTMKRKKII